MLLPCGSPGLRWLAAALVVAGAACGDDGGNAVGSGSDGGTTVADPTQGSTVDPTEAADTTAGVDTTAGSDTTEGGVDCDAPILCAWLLNEDDEASVHLSDNGGPLLVNVQSVMPTDELVFVQATGIPNYRITITQALHDALTGRPNAASDFVTGAPTVRVGEVIDWGADIGFRVPMMNQQCYAEDGGGGFWPPGPSCPTDQGHVFQLPRVPTPATETCYAIIGQTVVALLNGVVVYNWADGGSFNNEGVWNQLAQMFEVYDLDLCLGHATMTGTYHQHLDTPCLAEQFGDDGSEHSPIYGFAADGYPVYGKWFADGVQARSCWQTRNYDDAADPLGCGGAGVRSCVLVDNTDPSAGTSPAATGPNTSDIVTSFSGNDFQVVSGFYYEDYYFDADCFGQGGEYLDEHNGHEHDDLGYHYHVTESFPYQPGPTFAGTLLDGAPSVCSPTPYGMGPPPGP